MLRNKVQSIIQIFSLAIGLTVFMLVMLYVYDEMTVNMTIREHEHVYRVEFTDVIDDFQVPAALGTLLPEYIPEIESLTRFNRVDQSEEAYKDLIYMDENNQLHISEERKYLPLVDTGFFSVFPHVFLEGDPAHALRNSSGIVITESISRQLFGERSPLGKTIYNNHGMVFTVAGLVKDPVNTHLQYGAIRLFDGYDSTDRLGTPYNMFFHPGLFAPITYVRLNSFAIKSEVERKMAETWKRMVREYHTDKGYQYFGGYDIYLRPLADVYLAGDDISKTSSPYGNKSILHMFFLLGLTILLLGMVNYVNLTTARASLRTREIAIKKILGSSRSQLIIFFIVESMIITFFAIMVALSCLQIMFPKFNQLLQADIDLYFLSRPLPWIMVLLFLAVVGVLSGLYPALLMSKGSAILFPEKGVKVLGRGLNVRRFLMVLQYTVTIILILGILVTQNQLKYMKELDPGFETENIHFCFIRHNVYLQPESASLLRSRLLQYPDIEAVSFSQKKPGSVVHLEFMDPNNPLYGSTYGLIRADENYLDLMGLNIVEGKDFNQLSITELPPDSVKYRYCIINERLVNEMGLTDPVGDQLKNIWSIDPIITGVVEDFNFQSFRNEIIPLVIHYTKHQFWYLNIKVRPGISGSTWKEIDGEIEAVARVIYEGQKKRYIHRPFEFTRMDDFYDSMYEKEKRLADSYIYLSILALLIACLGLFGLSSFMAERRTKEIGIRKAMGSTDKQIFMMLARDFTKWIGVSILIGCPIGFLIMKSWLQQFAYRSGISIWTFLLTALIVFTVAFLTVSRQSWKTARANPLDSLRYE
jgi:putative ABC transport system permease protein